MKWKAALVIACVYLAALGMVLLARGVGALKLGTALAFSSTRSGSADLYLMDIERGWLRPITRSPAADLQPAFSPDGSQIAFSSDRDGSDDIFVMNLDGTNLRNLTGHPASETMPKWTYDGASIAFTSDWRDTPAVYLIDVRAAYTRSAAWNPIPNSRAYFDIFGVSPNNDAIVYVTAEAGSTDVYVQARNGLIKRVTTLGSTYNPVWSPDGRYIAFESSAPGNFDIYIAPADGEGAARNLTAHPAPDYAPAWSPDGALMAFVSNRAGSDDIYISTIDGGLLRRLTYLNGTNLTPVWLP